MSEKKALWTSFLLSWGSVLLAVGTAAKTAWELYTLVWDVGKTPQGNLRVVFMWFILFVVCVGVAIFVREFELRSIKNAKPIIKLKGFGFEIKTWKKGPQPYTVEAFIDIYNEPKKGALDASAVGVYPTIVWDDESGQEVDRNHGRWWIPNEDQEGAMVLQKVDLEANGMSRRLHFASSNTQSKEIEAVSRAPDRHTERRIHRTSKSFKIKIFLRDNKNTTAEFAFRISLYDIDKSPTTALRLEWLDKKPIERKEFDINELEKFVRDNPPYTGIFM
jgi:hypothetical protein